MQPRFTKLALALAPWSILACASAQSESRPEPSGTAPTASEHTAPDASPPAPEANATAPATSAPDVAASTPQDTWTQAELEETARAIQTQIEELRGERFKRPVAVSIASKEDFQKYMKQRIEMTETPEKLAADETVAKLLAVIPADMDLIATMMKLLEEQVGGYYDPASDSFSLMQGFPRGVARIILAHELDHALDDQLFEIDSRLEEFATNSDLGLAYHAVVEGSGTSVMNAWTIQHIGEVDLSGFEKTQEEMQKSMATAPAWMWKPLLASYLQGAAFLARADSIMAGQMKLAKSEDIRRAFEQPPRSSEQVLHPEKYWDAAKRDDPVRIAFATSELGGSWKVLREDTLGELALAIVCAAESEQGGMDMSNPTAILGLKLTNAVATGWDGDRAVLLGEEGGGRILRVVTRWDSERDAGEFSGALAVLLPNFEQAARDVAGAGADAKDSEATLEYGEDPTEVMLTIRSKVDRVDAKKMLKRLTHSVAAE